MKKIRVEKRRRRRRRRACITHWNFPLSYYAYLEDRKKIVTDIALFGWMKLQMNDDYYECLTPETTIAILEVRTLSPLTFSSSYLIFVLRSDLKMFHHFCCTSCSFLLGLFYFYYTVHFIITQYSTALHCTVLYNTFNNNYFNNSNFFL